ncbi:MAG: peptide chain release factor N(5)-glutamine methyltransferase [Clostridia bacterium]|nr:peptide chain release factor N(5)-glutamine methyltransferase [Clostridia bacterium]
MVILHTLLSQGVALLEKNTESPRFEAEVLMCEILKKDRLYLSVHRDDIICESAADKFMEFCKRRSLGEPSAYITGHREFMSLDFKVNKNVLIPRPDTEILTDKIITKYKNCNVSILDICTGSGAIAIALAFYMPSCKVYATDISDKALEVANENAENLLGNKKISFFKADALKKIHTDEKCDIVVSNPPYIESHVIETLDSDVKNFEPRLALDGGKDGLIFYDRIVNNIESVLAPGGELYFEIGFNQAKAVTDIMKTKFTNIQVTQDLAGLDRVVSGQLA